jgi:hypothetical protein
MNVITIIINKHIKSKGPMVETWGTPQYTKTKDFQKSE